MDWLAFFAQVIGSLAWPVTIVVVVLLLKDQISRLFPLLSRLKAGPLEAEFAREVEQIKDEARKLPLIKDFPVLVDAKRQQLTETAARDPRGAIAQAWAGVQWAARKAISQRLGESHSRDTLFKGVIALTQTGAITLEEAVIFGNLKGLRDHAIHASFDPSYESTLHFIDLAAQLEAKFQQLAPQDTVLKLKVGDLAPPAPE